MTEQLVSILKKAGIKDKEEIDNGLKLFKENKID
jgi:hypothetical protein